MKKWLPVIAVLALVIAAVVLLMLPEKPATQAARETSSPKPEVTEAPPPPTEDEVLNMDDLSDDTGSDLIPRLPTFDEIDEADKEYPTPFATPELPRDMEPGQPSEDTGSPSSR